MHTGTITRLATDRGYGFVHSGGADYFFHRSAVKNHGFDDLAEGQVVTFSTEESDRGPRCAEVVPADS